MDYRSFFVFFIIWSIIGFALGLIYLLLISFN